MSEIFRLYRSCEDYCFRALNFKDATVLDKDRSSLVVCNTWTSNMVLSVIIWLLSGGQVGIGRKCICGHISS